VISTEQHVKAYVYGAVKKDLRKQEPGFLFKPIAAVRVYHFINN